MILESLKITRKTYGEDEGKLMGSISYSTGEALIQFQLKEESIDDIFKIIAESLIEASKEAAKNLTSRTFQHQKQIEGK